MMKTKMIAAIAMLSIATPALAAPVATTASPAASLSIAKSARASTATKGASRLADGPSTLTAVFFGALIVGGIVALATSGGDKSDSN